MLISEYRENGQRRGRSDEIERTLPAELFGCLPLGGAWAWIDGVQAEREQNTRTDQRGPCFSKLQQCLPVPTRQAA